MSDDVIARRAQALEALLSPAPQAEAAGDAAWESRMVTRVGALLGHPGTWQTPAAPATLPAALLAEIRAATAEPLPTTEPLPAVEPERDPAVEPVPAAEPEPAPPVDEPVAVRRRRWPRLRRTLPRPRWTPPRLALGVAGALAAVLLAVVMFGGDLLGRGDDGPSRQIAVIQLTGTSAAPGARATMRAIERDAGWRLVADITGLAPAGPDVYYQGWAVAGAEMVPLGTFHMHQPGQVELWSGVPLRKFSRIEVTQQRVGAGQAPGVLVMVGQL
ncbi:anti-sigma factor domain-containing protein [Actinoplanes sp. NPDC049599]|uniref:anti-sigma factor domain-containing protein n=1 Tax=Actinoplanes sp. NPDC049599 TaxID=3363903 RepID=UPI003799F39B